MEQITLTVPVAFEIDIKRTNRHRNLEKVGYYLPLDVTLRSVTETEAPLAARFFRWDAPDSTVDVRVYEETFYARVFDKIIEDSSTRDWKAMHLSFEEMSKNALKGQSYRNPLFEALNTNPYYDYVKGDLPLFEPETVAFFSQEKIDSELQKVQITSSQLLVLNGEVWKKIVEPVYKIHPPGIFSSAPPHVEVAYSHYDIDKTRPTLLYNLNEWDEVLDYCQRKYHTFDIDEQVKADVYMPECFTVDKTTDAVMNYLKDALDGHRDELANADIETMLAWAQFRDAFNNVGRETDVEKKPALIDFTLEQAQAYLASPAPNKSAETHVKDAEARWMSRPLNINQLSQGMLR